MNVESLLRPGLKMRVPFEITRKVTDGEMLPDGTVLHNATGNLWWARMRAGDKQKETLFCFDGLTEEDAKKLFSE